MCDSFLGEGGGRGLTSYAIADYVAKPLPAFALISARPAPRRDLKYFKCPRFKPRIPYIYPYETRPHPRS
jgi:hypothetical protein